MEEKVSNCADEKGEEDFGGRLIEWNMFEKLPEEIE
jgi:hypothetical protein